MCLPAGGGPARHPAHGGESTSPGVRRLIRRFRPGRLALAGIAAVAATATALTAAWWSTWRRSRTHTRLDGVRPEVSSCPRLVAEALPPPDAIRPPPTV